MSERMQDVKSELLRTWDELDQKLRQVEALHAALNKPHRCWASRMSWGIVMCLSFALLFLHNSWSVERQTWEHRELAYIDDLIQHAMDTRTQEIIRQATKISAAYHQMPEERNLWFAQARETPAHWGTRRLP